MATQDISIWDENGIRAADVIEDTENNLNRLATTGVSSNIDFEKIKNGLLFSVQIHSASLSSNQELVVIFTTPSDKNVFLTWDYNLALQGNWVVWENAVRVGGTTELAYNHERNSTNTYSSQIWWGAAGDYTVVGAIDLETRYFGISGGVKSAGGGGSLDVWVLKRSTTYAFVLQSEKPGNKGDIKINFYEVDYP